MIHHHSDNLQSLSFKLKTPLKYSDEFTFIPLQVNNEDFLVQTPRLFTPFGIQVPFTDQSSTLQNRDKTQVMISFQNKDNDSKTTHFLQSLQFIYELVCSHYSSSSVQVNEFMKEYKGELIMNAKVKSDVPIFDTMKHRCDELPLYSYASYILYLPGLWVIKDQVWIQWYALQIRVENNIQLTQYAFKEAIPRPPPPPPPPPPMDKYKKMISLGIPSQAVNQQKQIDAKASINSTMLLSVQLKKTEPSQKMLNKTHGFEAPSLDSLQQALQKLRSVIRHS